MSKSRPWLSAAALAASALPAMASVPEATSSAEPSAPLVVRATGLTASDLIVSRDGTVAVDVRAHWTKVADSATNNGCS